METIKWGNITYLLGENNLSWVSIYSDHVDYGFFRGAELTSQSLEGQEKGFDISELMTARVWMKTKS